MLFITRIALFSFDEIVSVLFTYHCFVDKQINAVGVGCISTTTATITVRIVLEHGILLGHTAWGSEQI